MEEELENALWFLEHHNKNLTQAQDQAISVVADFVRNENGVMSKEYWRQVIRDYISCLCENFKDLTPYQENKVIEKLMNDNELWGDIDNTIDYYIRRV